MSLSDLASIGSLVSGVAVLVSLIFLYFQLRQVHAQAQQAERTQQATIRHTRAARIVDIALASADPSWAEAVRKGTAGDTDLSATQLWQFTNYMVARLSNAEDGFYQYREGAFDKAAYDRLVIRMKMLLNAAGVRASYKRQRPNLGGEFIVFMDKLLGEVSVAPPVDLLAQWTADVAAERSQAAP
jgi:hypothetical protein